MNKVIELIQSNGYIQDGHTQTDTFRIVTSDSYPLAGAEITLGSRMRFKKDANKFVTVGKRVTCFYTKNSKSEPMDFINFKTKDINAISNYLGESK